MAGFQFNYNMTIRQAKELEDLAQDMQNGAVRKLLEICGNIEASWTGEAGEAYLRYMQGVQNDLQKKVTYLRQTAEFLRSAAKKMKAAEAAARDAARRIR